MKTIVTTPIMRTHRAGLLAPTLLLGMLAVSGVGAGTGCGKTSYFEVQVAVRADVPNFPANCLVLIDSCVVTVSGAASDRFPLLGKACQNRTDFNIGLFQYATDSDSGNVSFKVEIFDGNNVKLGEGSAASTIKSGGRQSVGVNITPDTASPSLVNCR